MVKDDNAPVTKKDLKKELQRFATKEDLQDFRVELKNEILEEIKHYFDLTVENIRHDLLGANRDEIEVIKDRVTRIERHTGLAA